MVRSQLIPVDMLDTIFLNHDKRTTLDLVFVSAESLVYLFSAVCTD